ncbi:hypothetical protein PX699_05070 [Sphingobium sp. H39-3-25]|uniref:hypothetical protein n=1 Tax=Sphingobium arseniciresistens TaxID=3030834 RepID=UPI0023B915D9|nr:hypothetical protein [Sphingobium arseniciresistens]
MNKILVALAGVALFGSTPALAAKKVKAPAPATPREESQADKVELVRSEAATRVANWIAGTGDNRSLPYVIIDKNAAHAFLFDGEGKSLTSAPVLIGIATGDDATPGIGNKSLAEIGPAEKTTPAGRFLAKFGMAAGKQKVLWVDYATSVALHTIPTGNPKERRRQRMLSPGIEDNRITFGCINVPLSFYNKGVRPLFLKKGGYVYVLPDTKALEEVFPPLRVQPFLSAGAS